MSNGEERKRKDRKKISPCKVIENKHQNKCPQESYGLPVPHELIITTKSDEFKAFVIKI